MSNAHQLYKIYPPQDGQYLYFKKVIEKKQIYLSRPSEFNDPYDCIVTYDFEKATKAEMGHYAIKLATRNGEVNNDCVEAYKKKTPQELATTMRDHFLKEFEPKIGIYCMTRRINSLPMWAHYGTLHTGVAIGFNREALLKLEPGVIGKVRYKAFLPSLKELLKLKDTDKEMKLHLFRKGRDWAYEQEERYVKILTDTLDPASRNVKLSENSIHSIYFGSKMSAEAQEELTAFIKKHDASMSLPPKSGPVE